MQHNISDFEILMDIRNGTNLEQKWVWDLGYPYNVITSTLLKLIKQDYIDYNRTIWKPWLTDKGKLYLSIWR